MFRRTIIAKMSAFRREISSRIRNRPDKEHEMVFNRLIISFLLLSYLTITTLLSHEDIGTALAITVVFFICSFGFAADLLIRRGISPGRRALAMLTDLGSLSICMYIGGETTAVLYPIYLWVIFGNGFRFGVRYLMGSAALSVIGFTIVSQLSPYWLAHSNLSISLILALIILPAYTKKLITDLSDAKRQAEEANQSKTLFLASVSHELRTPLNAIIGMGELIRATPLNDEQTDMVRTIRGSAKALLTQIEGVLDFSRLEAGQMPIRVQEFDLYDALSHVQSTLFAAASAKDIRLTLHVAPATPHAVRGDSRQIQEILTNLGSNAVKFTDTGSVTISVAALTTTADTTRLRFEVSDTGIGVAPEARLRIFDRFTQADDSIIDRFGGTGLGLAIVKQLVELMGGEIGIDSTLGDGSTFWFELDLDHSTADEVRPPKIVNQQLHLVSDDASLCADARRAFATLGLEPAIHSDMDAAVAALKASAGLGVRKAVLYVDTMTPDTGAESVSASVQDQCPGMSVAIVRIDDDTGLPDPAVRPFFVTTLGWMIEDNAVELSLRAALASCGIRSDDSIEPSQESWAGGHCNVLVADDNQTNRKVLQKILERAGHRAVTVENGEQALDALNAEAFDIVLMDLNMPVMNGIEATKLYRFASLGQKRIPIVGVTADATPQANDRCIEAGMDATVTKPIDPTHLLQVIADHVGKSEPAKPDVEQTDDRVTPISAHPRFRSGQQQAIDVTALNMLRELGGDDFLADVIAGFILDTEKLILNMRQSAGEMDLSAFTRQAHALRSGAANVGAQGIFQLCSDLEHMELDELPTRGKRQLDELRLEFTDLRNVLAGYLPERKSL
ncbi:hybrid sensor histidine kinase/response regulator [Breoghania sp. L-A4]|uniref:hybrid sensor histidine kinase/response regulator n=1 Tax=Breoghania sp. L-A4 TaxID=2304600 RepID=UPI000E35EE06|nr:hybrid sensor histidine kinase/response regulator [Breoghania sp. L-A4]AXS38784.1 sensor histidine kinase [Breoghania sp. L-A4]